MKRYLSIYLHLLRFSMIQETTYRVGFFVEILVEIAYTVLFIASLQVIYWNVPQIAGYNYHQMLLYVGLNTIFSELILGLVYVHNLSNLPRTITDGGLDIILTKPLNSQFMVSLWRPYFAAISNLLVGFGLVIYCLNQLQLVINFGQFCFFLLLFLCGLIIAYSISMVITTFCFWWVNATPLPELAREVVIMNDRPTSIYQGIWRLLFTFIIPLAFMVTFPAQILLGHWQWWWIPTSIIFAFLFLSGSHLFWNFALKHYSSASS